VLVNSVVLPRTKWVRWRRVPATYTLAARSVILQSQMNLHSAPTAEAQPVGGSAKRFPAMARVRLLRRLPLAAEAALALAVANLAVRLLSQPRIVRLLGEPVERMAGPPAYPGTRARLVAGAVTRVARFLPWHPACLPQAIATRWMLRRRGIECEAHLGVVATEPFAAHAWVSVHGTVVQGGPIGHASEIARLR